MTNKNETGIRRAKEEDAAEISRVLYAAFVKFKPLYTEGGFAATAIAPQEVLARMSEGPVWVAEREGMVVGTGAAVVKGGSLYVRGMAVLPAGQGVGTGWKLLEEIERYATGAGCGRLFLTTTPFLAAAIHLYGKFGFRRVTGGPESLLGTPLFTMEKILREEG
jgi:GNAT superfamily N-acetyltransferase